MGFPDIFFDEGVYMSRAMNVLETSNPQESYLYDHPYFGQIILGGVLKLVGYPDSLNSESDAESLKELYMTPRIFMGLLAVLDTFLIYKIAEKKYNSKVAILAAVIFAVLPFSWVFKRITLDALLLPFMLGSILVALHAQKSPKLYWVLFSGLLFGFAVFTKIPAIIFGFLAGLIIFQGRKKIADVMVWLFPVILIP
ncbi:MAG: glycosyltransferase family 39 protein, partial [Nitrosopumilaceae archaeon]|nr:glycosyltransferase family 39 protein [Nitrosopumilaceae archaeon]